ncbi:hypothetical protein F5B19DRAFT_485545 [Rostrohypoxylon terebratum]|nr:hypothetical protein F5B19DRAFT_485545 [Rostrohypoxylon terebratum]
MAAVLKHSTPQETSTTDAVSYTRLHITPLDETLLDVVVPSSVLPRARNISYHIIKTFPEKRYGFVDLPTTDAEKIKKKLNGAVLRGSKMRVEKAKPESYPTPAAAVEADTDTNTDTGANQANKEKNKLKKRKREIDVTPGVELQSRKVKRGWTTSEREMIDEKRKSKKDKKDKKDKKKKRKEAKSKYTDGPECLFKTKLPDTGSSSKSSEEVAGHKKKKRKSDREIVIHEFEKTVKHPSFLKTNIEKSISKPVTFQDGLGWIDESGNVVEPVVSKRPTGNSSAPTMTKSKSHKTPLPPEEEEEEEEEDDTRSSGSSSDGSEEEVSDQEVESSSEEEAETKAPLNPPEVKIHDLSSPVSILKSESARPKSSSSMTSLTIKIPPVTPSAAKVHPLEALYKRPKGDAATSDGVTKEAQPFSFFGDEEDDDIEEEKVMGPPSQPPMTPFTKQDFDFRNVRSAAPTPDTAHPSSKSFNLWPRQGLEDDGAEEDDGNDGYGNDENVDTVMKSADDEGTAASSDKPPPTSDFQKQFWESRGDLNRSWRKRRKAASKEKRYRENRARAERAI